MVNEIASTIFQQLGGAQFEALTGCQCIADGPKLVVLIPRNASRANRMHVTLDIDDTYTVEFFRFNRSTLSFGAPLKSVGGVYVEQLRRVFESQTGLLTTL